VVSDTHLQLRGWSNSNSYRCGEVDWMRQPRSVMPQLIDAWSVVTGMTLSHSWCHEAHPDKITPWGSMGFTSDVSAK